MPTLSMLETARKCPRKAVFFENLSGNKGKYYTLSRIIGLVIEKLDISGPTDLEKDVKALVEESFEDVGARGYVSDFEVQTQKRILTDQIVRMAEYIKVRGGAIKQKNLEKKFLLGGLSTSIRANMLIEYNDRFEVVIVDRKKPAFTKKGQSHPSNSLKLYGLTLLSEELQPTLKKEVRPAIYHLQSKKDSTNVFMTQFDAKMGDNITYWYMSQDEKDEIEKEYKTVTMDVKKRSEEKDCKGCQFELFCNGSFQPRSVVKTVAVKESMATVDLTKGQAEMVSATKGIFRVNAVAGSGKTTTVALRTLNLIEEGCDPGQILMITFTDKARGEMTRKIQGYAKAYYAGGLDISGLEIETFNSWGHKIISKHYKELGFTKAPTVIDDLTKRDIIVSLLESYRSFPVNYANPFMDMRYVKGAVIEMSNIIDKVKSHDAKTKEEVVEIIGWEERMAGHLLEFYKEYNAEITKRNMLDYDDQLRLLRDLKPLKIFENLPYRHVIIDEFQDSDPNQIKIIEDMLNENKNVQSLVVVGDMMQSIYSFRNTSPENLVNFGSKFPKVKDINLGENFRSQSGITALANQILDKESKTSARILAQRDFLKKPVIRAYDEREEEFACMVRAIKTWIKGKTPYKNIAVLGRTRSELLKYQSILEEEGIPTILRAPEVIRENHHIQAIFSLAAFARDPENTSAMALYAKSIGIDPVDFHKVASLAQNIRKELEAADPSEQLEAFYKRTKPAEEADYLAADFMDAIRKKGFPVLAKVTEYIVKYNAYQVKEGFHVPIDDVDAVTLITVHSAKGLEYPNVVLMTNQFKDDVMNENSEEKRLLYVGVTRAKDALAIILPSSQKNFIRLLRAK